MGRWAMPRGNAGVDRIHEVYDASYRRLVGQLTGVTGAPVEAEDAVMEAFARAVNHSRAFLDADRPDGRSAVAGQPDGAPGDSGGDSPT